MPLDVIGAGLGRTGTRSLKDALERLGFVRTYHMTDLFQDPSRLGHWEDAHAGRDVDWEALFDGYRATVDYPGALYWRELAERYPSAKVVLTVRDPRKWYASVMRTIYVASRGTAPEDLMRARHRAWTDGAIWQGQFEGRMEDEAFVLDKFRAHNEAVKAAIPAERLLVYEVEQGWGPLCAFLGVPVPSEPFPLMNTGDEFVARIAQARAAQAAPQASGTTTQSDRTSR